MSTTGRLRIAVACVGLVLCAACGTPSPRDPFASSDPDQTGQTGGVAIELLEPMLGSATDDLLVIEPEESVEVTIVIGDPNAAARLAEASGLTAEIVAPDEAIVSGPVNRVMQFLLTASPTKVELRDDQRARRWLPEAKPDLPVPTAGNPYLAAALPVDRGKLRMPPALREPLLVTLTGAIRSIDGRPYARVEVEGSCYGEPPSCDLILEGFVAGAAGPDRYVVFLDADKGGRPFVDHASFQAVPRPLGREAEWIARHDAPAAQAIAAYDTCCGFGWDPMKPGVVTIDYTRACHASVARPGPRVAATGDCFDGLTIAVDLATGTVVSIDERPGP